MSVQKAWMVLSIVLSLVLSLGGCAGVERDAFEFVKFETRVSAPLVEAEVAGIELVAFEVGVDVPAGILPERSLDLALVLDRSGSMSGEQLEDAKTGLVSLLNELSEDDYLTLVVFGTEADLILERTSWGDVDRPALESEIRALKPRGTTAMTEALNLAVSELSKEYLEGVDRRLLLFSDGRANTPSGPLSVASSAGSMGISMSTLGFGPYFDEDLLASLADSSGGQYRYIELSREIPEFFVAEVKDMRQVVCENASLSLQLGPGVRILEAYGAQPSFVTEGVAEFYLGDLSSGEERVIALKLELPPGEDGQHLEVVDARVRWVDAVSKGMDEYLLSDYFGAKASKDLDAVSAAKRTEVVEEVERLHASWEIQQGLDYLSQGDLVQGNLLLEQGRDRVEANSAGLPHAVELNQLVDESIVVFEEYEGTAKQSSQMKKVKVKVREMSGY